MKKQYNSPVVKTKRLETLGAFAMSMTVVRDSSGAPATTSDNTFEELAKEQSAFIFEE